VEAKRAVQDAERPRIAAPPKKVEEGRQKERKEVHQEELEETVVESE
jgi:hypothetical protein